MNVQDLAKICHEANKAFCETLGDTTQVGWDEAPDWQKSSAINGVSYHLQNPDSRPSDSHLIWSAEKIREGWKYGPVKDAEKKEHPCLVDYEQLPMDQRFKDVLFTAIVNCASNFTEIDPYK